MKRLIAILCLLSAMLLAGCSTRVPPPESPESFDEKVIATGKYFTVCELTDSNNVVRYRYTVNDIEGNILETALCAEAPVVIQASYNVIEIDFTANGHRFTRFFDTDKLLVSESYKNVFWSDGVLVAKATYDNGQYLSLESIFDENGYNYRVKLDTLSWRITVKTAELSADGTKLSVSYVEGDGNDEKMTVYNEILPLPAEQA